MIAIRTADDFDSADSRAGDRIKYWFTKEIDHALQE